MERRKRVCVIGLGYVGLPTAAFLSNAGHDVVGVDINQKVVDTINRGEIHIVEPGLDSFVKAAVSSGRLRASAEIRCAEVYIICVPTPLSLDGVIPKPDISAIASTTQALAAVVKPGDLVILESTSPIGTTELIRSLLQDAQVATDGIHIAYCPERVLPGKVISELSGNDRVVGGLSSEASAAVAGFYRGFVQGDVIETDSRTAEMCKLAENSFRDVNIAFANELSLICHKEEINVWELIELANRHPRVQILQPGVGVGGHCIAVDPWFIVARDEENAQLIRTAREVNDNKARWVVSQINRKAADFIALTGSKPRIACLGLAFKADIDDLRESPALEVARMLAAQGYDVSAVEPNISSHAEFQLLNVNNVIDDCDVIALLVKHREFLFPDVRERFRQAGALDFCGALVQ